MKTFDDTNRDGTPRRPIEEDPLVEISKEEANLYEYGPESRSERLSNSAVKGSVWLLGIMAVFALAILIAWLVGISDSPLSSRSDARQAMALSTPQPSLNPANASVRTKTPAQFVAILVKPVAQKPGVAAASAVTASPSGASSAAATAAGSETSGYDDRIEREAREVIQGDFGNNPERKIKLGADYAAVQKRVNEILHI